MKNDNAVSPVIGVILMVGITVVLAGIIAMFVYGMSGSLANSNTQKLVAVSVQQSASDKITVTYIGGQEAGNLKWATINITADDGSFLAVGNLTNVVGNTITATSSKLIGENHVIVVGYFTDNSAQVISDTYV